MANTTASVAVNLTTKQVTVTGQMAFRETVQVTLSGTGISGFDAAGMVLRLIKRVDGTDVEMATCTSFTAVGATFVGLLSLNTVPLQTFFANLADQAKRNMTLGVWDGTNNALLVNDRVKVQNNPYETGMTAASPLGETYMPTVPDPETNWQVVNGKFCIWDIGTAPGYRSLWSKDGNAVFGEIET